MTIGLCKASSNCMYVYTRICTIIYCYTTLHVSFFHSYDYSFKKYCIYIHTTVYTCVRRLIHMYGHAHTCKLRFVIGFTRSTFMLHPTPHLLPACLLRPVGHLHPCWTFSAPSSPDDLVMLRLSSNAHPHPQKKTWRFHFQNSARAPAPDKGLARGSRSLSVSSSRRWLWFPLERRGKGIAPRTSEGGMFPRAVIASSPGSAM